MSVDIYLLFGLHNSCKNIFHFHMCDFMGHEYGVFSIVAGIVYKHWIYMWKCIKIKSPIGSIKLSGIKEFLNRFTYLWQLKFTRRLTCEGIRERTQQKSPTQEPTRNESTAIRPIYFDSHKIELFTFWKRKAHSFDCDDYYLFIFFNKFKSTNSSLPDEKCRWFVLAISFSLVPNNKNRTSYSVCLLFLLFFALARYVCFRSLSLSRSPALLFSILRYTNTFIFSNK